LDVGLKRGILVTGRVTNKATGRPVQAVVEYFTFSDNPSLKGLPRSWSSQVVSSKKDGSFALAALPGRGIVTAKTHAIPRSTYLPGKGADAIAGLDERLGGFPTVPHVCFPGQFENLTGIELGADAGSANCDLQFDPGRTIKGTILDPDGKPLAGAKI